jgi:Sulfotransferase domain
MSSESTPLPHGRLPIMVVSHERSGTHFTMNALAECFDYVSNPWIDIDRHRFNINYFHAPSLKNLLLHVAAARSANLIKSHHEFEFFKRFAAATEGVLNIVYVYRHPADVMLSFWRFLHTWDWAEGPTVDTVLGFATAAPMGQLMRYQFRQYPTMLDRWANHVEHWVDAARRANNIHIVRYEDLAERYDDTVKRLGMRLGMPPTRIVPPSRTINVVQAGSLAWAPAPDNDNRDAVTELALAKFPALMDRLGYGPVVPAAVV